MSTLSPKKCLAMALHSTCQPGRPRARHPRPLQPTWGASTQTHALRELVGHRVLYSPVVGISSWIDKFRRQVTGRQHSALGPPHLSVLSLAGLPQRKVPRPALWPCFSPGSGSGSGTEERRAVLVATVVRDLGKSAVPLAVQRARSQSATSTQKRLESARGP